MVIVFSFIYVVDWRMRLKYINGKNVLPKNLLLQIQKYIEGEILYIPKKDSTKVRWGEKNGTREYLINRNNNIFNKHLDGKNIEEISSVFHLSNESIRKIIYNLTKK